MAGAPIAVAQHAGAIKSSPVTGMRLGLLALFLLAAWLGSHDFMAAIGAFDAVWQPAVIAALCGLLTMGAIQMDGRPMRLEAVVRAVARLSYALYLVHYPLIPLVLAVADKSAHPKLAFWLAYLTGAYAAAALLHWAIEKPFLLVKDDLAQRRDAAMPLSAPPTPVSATQYLWTLTVR